MSNEEIEKELGNIEKADEEIDNLPLVSKNEICMNNIRNHINKYMWKHQISKTKFSYITCFDRTTLHSLIIGGSKTTSLKTLVGLCQAMGCSIDDLIN